jgi:hypothetical protein
MTNTIPEPLPNPAREDDPPIITLPQLQPQEPIVISKIDCEKVAVLKRIADLLDSENYLTRLYDTLCSNVGTSRKTCVDDDALLPQSSSFSRLTLKVRSMGTNTYIAFGTSAVPAFRFTGASQSHTFIAPTIKGSVIPFIAGDIGLIGDGATGVVEVTGVRVVKSV